MIINCIFCFLIFLFFMCYSCLDIVEPMAAIGYDPNAVALTNLGNVAAQLMKGGLTCPGDITINGTIRGNSMKTNVIPDSTGWSGGWTAPQAIFNGGTVTTNFTCPPGSFMSAIQFDGTATKLNAKVMCSSIAM